MGAKPSIKSPAELAKAGLKKTTPRVKILSLLERSAKKRHFTAEDVYRLLSDAGEDIGLGTIYRVLTQFEGAGLVIRHNFEGGRSVFELNDEAHHDHMVCVACGGVFEFRDRTIEERQHAVARQAGFELDHHALYLYGVCQGMRRDGKCSMNAATGLRGGRRNPERG
jgi:Fur family ferric uptake transcriptional regulator